MIFGLDMDIAIWYILELVEIEKFKKIIILVDSDFYIYCIRKI